MRHRVQVRRQVKDFLERLAPEPRRRLRREIGALGSGKGNRLALREGLAGFHRLRSGRYRVIFQYLAGGVIDCVYAEERSLVYHLFEREILERLRHEGEDEPAEGDPKVGEQSAGFGPRPKKRRAKLSR